MRPQPRRLEFDLDCGPPVQMLDIPEPLPGTGRDGLFDFDFDLGVAVLTARAARRVPARRGGGSG